jgi:LacI family transcriptional regulator
MQKHTTINQVALEAGVSIQTVSRVINNRYDVAPETRQRVQEAIARLGYQPNAIARGLASRRSRTLGLITTDFTDYSFTQVVTGAEAEAHQHDYFFMLGSASCDPEDEPKYLRLLTERHVEGVLFARLGSQEDLEHLMNNLEKRGVPVVTTGSHRLESPFAQVDVNNREGGYKATQYLIQNRHIQIACITGPLSSQSAFDRTEGFRQALAEAGITVQPQLIAEGDYTHRSGYLAMKKILASGQPFTALFAQNDRMAIGAISALHEIGQHVPEDISVVGYDDIPEAEFANPPLTTIRQPMEAVGAAAARLLIKMVEDSESSVEQVLFDTELVWRASVAPCQLNIAV